VRTYWSPIGRLRGNRSRIDVAAFDYALKGQLLHMRDELSSGLYCPGPYRRFMVSNPKPRVISAAPFRDRVVHHALCNVIEPLFESLFISNTATQYCSIVWRPREERSKDLSIMLMCSSHRVGCNVGRKTLMPALIVIRPSVHIGRMGGVSDVMIAGASVPDEVL
jgi:hypothetical protein